MKKVWVKLGYKKKKKEKNDFNKKQIKTFEITNVANLPHFSIKNFTLAPLPLPVLTLTAFSSHRPQILYCSTTYIYTRRSTIRLRWNINSIFFGRRTSYNCNVFTINCMCEFLFTSHFISHAESSLCSTRYFYNHSRRNLSYRFYCLQSIHSTFWDRRFFCRYSRYVFSFLSRWRVMVFISGGPRSLPLRTNVDPPCVGGTGRGSPEKRTKYFFKW